MTVLPLPPEAVTVTVLPLSPDTVMVEVAAGGQLPFKPLLPEPPLPPFPPDPPLPALDDATDEVRRPDDAEPDGTRLLTLDETAGRPLEALDDGRDAIGLNLPRRHTGRSLYYDD